MAKNKRKKRVPAYVKKAQRQLYAKIAKDIRSRYKVKLMEIIKKGKIENAEDVYIISQTLTAKAKSNAVFAYVWHQAQFGKTPAEIIASVKPKPRRRQKKEAVE